MKNVISNMKPSFFSFKNPPRFSCEILSKPNYIVISLFGSVITFFAISRTYMIIENSISWLINYFRNNHYIFHTIYVENDLYHCKKIALLLDNAIKKESISKNFLSRIFKTSTYYSWPSLDKRIIIPLKSSYYKLNHPFFGGDLFIKPQYLNGEIFSFTLAYDKRNVIFKNNNILELIVKQLNKNIYKKNLQK